MDVMFWVWLCVIIVTAIIEFATMEIVSIWFTFGAIIPFIMSATNSVRWEIQVVVFVVISAILIISLRSITKKYLLRNSGAKTNADSIIGKQYRMLQRTDFENIGSLKVNDVVWTAIGLKQQTIEKGEIVEVVRIDGNKLVVKKLEQFEEKVKVQKPDKEVEKNVKVEKPEKKVEEKKVNKERTKKVEEKKVNKKATKKVETKKEKK